MGRRGPGPAGLAPTMALVALLCLAGPATSQTDEDDARLRGPCSTVAVAGAFHATLMASPEAALPVAGHCEGRCDYIVVAVLTSEELMRPVCPVGVRVFPQQGDAVVVVDVARSVGEGTLPFVAQVEAPSGLVVSQCKPAQVGPRDYRCLVVVPGDAPGYSVLLAAQGIFERGVVRYAVL